MNEKVFKLSEELFEKENISDENLKFLLETKEDLKPLFKLAKTKRKEIYGNSVYLKGLIEITNNKKICIVFLKEALIERKSFGDFKRTIQKRKYIR